MSNNAIINTNSANLSNAITVYNDGLKNGASMETMKTYNSAAKSALKAVNAEELKNYAGAFSVRFSENPISAWEDYLVSPWVKVSAIKKEEDNTLSVGEGVTMLPLSALMDKSVALFNNTRFEKRAKVLWYLCVQFALADSDVINPIRASHPEMYKEIRENLKEWKADADSAYMEKISLATTVSVGVMEKMLNAIVADILPAEMTLAMRKADVRNIRDSIVATSIASAKASKMTVHNFNSFCVQLVDAMYHRHSNLPYEISDKTKK